MGGWKVTAKKIDDEVKRGKEDGKGEEKEQEEGGGN